MIKKIYPELRPYPAPLCIHRDVCIHTPACSSPWCTARAQTAIGSLRTDKGCLQTSTLDLFCFWEPYVLTMCCSSSESALNLGKAKYVSSPGRQHLFFYSPALKRRWAQVRTVKVKIWLCIIMSRKKKIYIWTQISKGLPTYLDFSSGDNFCINRIN